MMLIPASWLVATTVADQVASQNEYNSVFQRINWFREASSSTGASPPCSDMDLRYWYNDPTFAFQPPQAELEVFGHCGRRRSQSASS